MKPAFIASATIAIIASTQPAMAHLGHVGELAGHGHWIGLGALGVAAGLAAAAALAEKRRRRREKDAAEEEADATPETAEETA